MYSDANICIFSLMAFVGHTEGVVLSSRRNNILNFFQKFGKFPKFRRNVNVKLLILEF